MSASEHDIAYAASLLVSGHLVALPTETVYGLGASALSDAAVASIYAMKERPQFNPLIVHVRSLEEAARYVKVSPLAKQLAARFWPGALTLVLERRADCPLSLLVSAGMDTVAIRMPAHPVAQKLLEAAGIPVAAPSANRSGRISPTEPAHVRGEFANRVFILDGGMCSIGLESTVIDARGDVPVILRPGSVTQEMLREAVGKVGMVDTSGGYISPGMLASHYAPEKPLRLDATELLPGEGLLAFGAAIPAGAGVVYNLSERGDLQEAAANLFRMLRQLDASAARSLAAMPVPHEGIGEAINDRLRRAAADKTT